MPRLRPIIALIALSSLASCAPSVHRPVKLSLPEGLTVMTFHLTDYGYADRDGNHQRDNLKPADERAAAVQTILTVSPDILVLQGIEADEQVEELAHELSHEGLIYENHAMLNANASPFGLAILSSMPMTAKSHTNIQYRANGLSLTVMRGYLEAHIEYSQGNRLTLFNTDLKSRSYHPAGQTEMRRNEMRILGQLVRQSSIEYPNDHIILAGCLNENSTSPSLRELTSNHSRKMANIQPRSLDDGEWTYYSEPDNSYHRYDHLIADPVLAAGVLDCVIVPWIRQGKAVPSKHRPVAAVFRI